MSRLFVITALCLSFAVTACDKGGKKRVPIKKGQTGNDAAASERSRNLNKVLDDKSCLRVDKLIAEMIKLKDESVVIYTADLNLGNLSGGGAGADPIFEPQVDEKTRANALLKNEGEPILESLLAQNLQKSSHIAFLLSPSEIDEKCELAAFNSIAGTSYAIFKKGPNFLWMRNRNDPSEFIFYEYNRKDKLTITHYTPNSETFCAKRPRLLKRKYVVAREEARDKLEIDRGFAELIANNIEEPAEMTAALGKDSEGRLGGNVFLKFWVMRFVQETLQSENFTRPACGTP